MTVHRVDGEVMLASSGYRLLRSLDGGKTWQEDGRAPVPRWRRIIDSVRLLRRISRGGVAGVFPQADGSRLCIVPKMMMRAEAGSAEYRCVFRFDRGSRPLNLCRTKDGKIYWGEYFLNLRRSQPVRIFCSKDGGRSWGIVYTFPRGRICHVHRVVYDPFWKAILVCTGDRDSESAIFRTDNFQTLAPLCEGNQRYRTTCIIPLPGHVIYGTDNPKGTNSIMAIDRETCSVREIQRLPGPVLYGCRVGELVVFATMVEKRHHEATLWAGGDKSFRLVAHLKTGKANPLWREIVGYPRAVLPEGPGHWPYLYFTPLGLSTYADDLFRINLECNIMKRAVEPENSTSSRMPRKETLC